MTEPPSWSYSICCILNELFTHFIQKGAKSRISTNKKMPIRWQYYHAFLDFTGKTWDVICQRRSVCSDRPSDAWHQNISDYKRGPLRILIYNVKWRLYQQSWKNCFECFRRTVDREGRWSVKRRKREEDKEPPKKGKFLLLGGLHHF